MRERLSAHITAIRERGNYRKLRYVEPISLNKVSYGGRELLNLCSNSYLSLHAHPEVMAAAKEAVDRYGAGTCSSRSVSGSIDLYSLVEQEVAAFKGYDGSLIFSNGYLANMGIIATLTEETDVIFSDELNHSSIIDSTRLSRARKVVYHHCDPEDLERKLKTEPCQGRRFIITESVFSMDGDLAPLDEIHRLKEHYGADMMVDEAHATGVFGPTGKGVEEDFGLTGRMDVQMGTFGKSLGSFGAFVLSNRPFLSTWSTGRVRSCIRRRCPPRRSRRAGRPCASWRRMRPSGRASGRTSGTCAEGLPGRASTSGRAGGRSCPSWGGRTPGPWPCSGCSSEGVFLQASDAHRAGRHVAPAPHDLRGLTKDDMGGAGGAYRTGVKWGDIGRRRPARFTGQTCRKSTARESRAVRAPDAKEEICTTRRPRRVDKRYIWHPFTQMKDYGAWSVISTGRGSFLIDVEGKRYIDGVSSLWVLVPGTAERSSWSIGEQARSSATRRF
jgi:hypothetical protein